MKVTPLRTLQLALLCAALAFVGYPLVVHHAARAQTTQPPRIGRQRVTPTPTPTPFKGRGTRGSSQDPDQTNTPTPTPTPTPRSGGHAGRNTAIGVGIGAGVLAAILATHGGGDAEKLSKDGPKFEKQFNMSNFAVKGFARGGWPVVVAYEVSEPAIVQLSVAVDKNNTFVERLDGTPGAHEVIVHLPATFDDKPRVAAYALSATSDSPGALRPVPLQLYGLGAGYNAVGSVGIDQVIFAPGRVSATQAQQQADYSFHSLFDFNKVSAEFMHITRGRDGEIIAERVADVDFDGIRRDEQRRGQWNCRKGKKVSQGPHQLQVRAWRGLRDGGDWVAAVARQSVFVD